MTVTDKVGSLDWARIGAALDEEGVATTPPLLTRAQCRKIDRLYDDREVQFRSVIDMARYNFGRGEYKYFDYPLPADVQALRSVVYPHLAKVANHWAALLGQDVRWPRSLATLLRQCHAAKQRRPTPLMLRYRANDYNCLHQDLYGPIHFPLQVVIQLTEPGRDFEGGELVLVEQRPRMQSRPVVVRLAQGEAAVFSVRERPRQGRNGYHRVQMRHGVGKIVRGQRTTLGLIFHDAS